MFMDAPAHTDTQQLCAIAEEKKAWALHIKPTFAHMQIEKEKATKAAKSTLSPKAPACQPQTSGNGGGDDDDCNGDGDDEDDGAPVPIDENGVPQPNKWIHGKLFHWDPFFGHTSSCH